jgi:hypothetical protein
LGEYLGGIFAYHLGDEEVLAGQRVKDTGSSEVYFGESLGDGARYLRTVTGKGMQGGGIKGTAAERFVEALERVVEYAAESAAVDGFVDGRFFAGAIDDGIIEAQGAVKVNVNKAGREGRAAFIIGESVEAQQDIIGLFDISGTGTDGNDRMGDLAVDQGIVMPVSQLIDKTADFAGVITAGTGVVNEADVAGMAQEAVEMMHPETVSPIAGGQAKALAKVIRDEGVIEVPRWERSFVRG